MAALKCKYCGNNLSLEDVYCPYCGKKNEEAKKHARDMQRYQAEFEETKDEVYSTTRSYGVLYARIILMVILAAGIIAAAVIATHSYSFRRLRQEKDAVRNAAAYTQEMDELLEQEDYLKFSEFCQAHNISAYAKGYEKYELIITAARQYEYFYGNLAEIIYAGESRTIDYVVESMADNLDYFYRNTTGERMEQDYWKNFDEDQTRAAFEGMNAQVDQLLQTYLGLTEEEADSMRTLSKSRRSLLIEEHLPGGAS